MFSSPSPPFRTLRKGERLILFVQKPDATRSEFIRFAKEHHASDLMIPAEVVAVEKLPMLGTGKVDQMAVNELARARAARGLAKPAVVA